MLGMHTELPRSLKESLSASKAHYVQLGKSGLRVSVPIFGAMGIGHPDWAPWVLEEKRVCILFPIGSPMLTPDTGFTTAESCL